MYIDNWVEQRLPMFACLQRAIDDLIAAEVEDAAGCITTQCALNRFGKGGRLALAKIVLLRNRVRTELE